METVVLNRFESKMWVNRIVLNSLQCNRIIDCGKLWEAKVVNRGVKMHIHWIKYSKPLRILDIFVE